MMDNGISLKQHGCWILKPEDYLMFLSSASFYAFFLPKSLLSKQVMRSVTEATALTEMPSSASSYTAMVLRAKVGPSHK